MTFRFLHLADLHLETHFGGAPRTRERLRAATLEAFTRAADYALAAELDAVLIAGDLFDDELLSLNTEIALVREMRRMATGGVHVLYCCGNHDPGKKGRRAEGLGLEAERTGGDERSDAIVHMFRSRRPQRIELPLRDGSTAVVVGAGHATAREDTNLAEQFPVASSDADEPWVGLLHTQVDTARGAESHDRYAPSTPGDFERARYTYWALGHVHQRGCAVPGMPVWYSGNLQGRNAREVGPKGGLLVRIEHGVADEPEFVPLAPVRWERLVIDDLEDVRDLDALVTLLATEADRFAADIEEELVLRFALEGRSPLLQRLRDPEALADIAALVAEQAGLLEALIDVRGLRGRRDMEQLERAPSVVGEALGLVRAAHASPALLEELAPARLPGLETRFGDPNDVTLADREAYLSELLVGLEEEILDRVMGDQ